MQRRFRAMKSMRKNDSRGRRWDRSSIFLVALVLASCAPAPREHAPIQDDPRLTAHEPDGARLFLDHCATCHLGGGGLLGSPRTPDLFEEALPRGDSEQAILQAIRFGIDPPRMPAFAPALTLEETRAITASILERRRAVDDSGDYSGDYSGDQRKRSPRPNR
jgi:cytochrome c6